MEGTPSDTPAKPGDRNAASSQTGNASPEAAENRKFEIHLHPRYAETLRNATEELTSANLDMKAAALELIDQQIRRLSAGDPDVPRPLATLVIATLAETRVRLLDIDPTTADAGIELMDIVTKLQTLVRSPKTVENRR